MDYMTDLISWQTYMEFLLSWHVLWLIPAMGLPIWASLQICRKEGQRHCDGPHVTAAEAMARAEEQALWREEGASNRWPAGDHVDTGKTTGC